MQKTAFSFRLTLCALGALSVLATVVPAQAAQQEENRTSGFNAATPAPRKSDLPTLVVSQDPPPEVIYRRGSRDTILTEDAPAARTQTSKPIETLVTRKANELTRDLNSLKNMTGDYQYRLRSLQSKCDTLASKYYEIVASISTELQGGTTAGNPILVDRWNNAKERLDTLANTATGFNGLATDLNDAASKATFLQDNIRAAYALSGAVKEDHTRLREIEDDLNQTIVAINRLMTTTSDEINRRQSYQRSETLNLQTMSLAIANGELYGRNLTNTLYKQVAEESQPMNAGTSPVASGESTRRPLVIIRFDRPNVNYQKALYSAIDQTLAKYPTAAFDVVAVSTSQGNMAQSAMAAADSRKYGQDVLRSLTQMGLPLERVKLSTTNSANIRSNEVRIFLQ